MTIYHGILIQTIMKYIRRCNLLYIATALQGIMRINNIIILPKENVECLIYWALEKEYKMERRKRKTPTKYW